MRRFITATVVVAAVVALISLGLKFLDTEDEVGANLVLPIPEGYCQLSNDDLKGIAAIWQLKFAGYVHDTGSLEYFFDCEQMVEWQKFGTPIKDLGLYVEFITPKELDDSGVAELLGGLRRSFRQEAQLAPEDAIAEIRSGTENEISLGLLREDHDIFYAGQLSRSANEGDEVRIDITVYGYVPVRGKILVLSMGRPLENEMTVQNLLSEQDLIIQRLVMLNNTKGI